MTYNQLIASVAEALTPLVEETGGKVEVAESLEEAQAMLDEAPRNWKLILHWEGFGDHASAREGMTAHQVATVIHAPRGLSKDRSPIKPSSTGRPAFSSYITAVVAWMTSMRFPDGTNADFAGFSLAGSNWVQSGTKQHTGHALNWRLDAALPAPANNIILNFPHLNP